MKTKVLQIIVVLSLFVSCGPKPSKSIAIITKETNTYISQVDKNSNLKEEMVEGALTDAEGFKDIGKFKYSVYFDEKTNELIKIKNVEMTDKTISETYYFKDGNLVLIDTNLSETPNKMYIQKSKVISESKMDDATQKVLLEKAKRFQKAFQKDH
ncbi:hypothetical protein [Gelidibacter sp.]|uniref:hypothetical protein n=1 Tax=Gelidibacter sp. TaxID=2018083 RepID=UPI003264FF86